MSRYPNDARLCLKMHKSTGNNMSFLSFADENRRKLADIYAEQHFKNALVMLVFSIFRHNSKFVIMSGAAEISL